MGGVLELCAWPQMDWLVGQVGDFSSCFFKIFVLISKNKTFIFYQVRFPPTIWILSFLNHNGIHNFLY